MVRLKFEKYDDKVLFLTKNEIQTIIYALAECELNPECFHGLSSEFKKPLYKMLII